MFRRPGKNPLEENPSFYAEESSRPASYLFNQKKSEASSPFDPASLALPHEGIEKPSAPLSTNFSLKEEIPETTLGEGVTFRGELSFERLLRIDGIFEGTLLSEGKIIVGPKGKVKADLNMREAIIEGEVEGNIRVKEKLELRGSAKVTGDISAKSLCVDEGVELFGHVDISSKVQ